MAPKTLKLNKNENRAEKIRKGAKGISVLRPILGNRMKIANFFATILMCFAKIRETETIAPIQKASTVAGNHSDQPRNQPSPSISLASPKPIHLPRDKSQNKKNGKATVNPDKRFKRKLLPAKFPQFKKTNLEKARTPKTITDQSLIILWRRS